MDVSEYNAWFSGGQVGEQSLEGSGTYDSPGKFFILGFLKHNFWHSGGLDKKNLQNCQVDENDY